MKSLEKPLLIMFVMLSLISSFAFVYYGLTIILDKTASHWLITFAYVTAGYGLGNIAILSVAWNSRSHWACNVNMLIALSYFGVFIMDAFNFGIENSFEFAGILLVAVILWCNWMAVKKVVLRT